MINSIITSVKSWWYPKPITTALLSLSEQWNDYLIQHPLANTLWSLIVVAQSIKTEQLSAIPIPIAMPTDNGFQFVWDYWEHHLDIDIIDNGGSCMFEWFYRNRITEDVASNDTNKIDDEFLNYLDMIVSR